MCLLLQLLLPMRVHPRGRRVRVARSTLVVATAGLPARLDIAAPLPGKYAVLLDAEIRG